MKKFIISAVCAAALTATLTAAASAENNSVSGYVSLMEGHKIVGYETSLYLQYGTQEDKSVVRAIGDLAVDIEAVTGKKIGMAANDDFLYGALPPHGIVYDLFGPMCVFTYDAVPADSICYVAAYNSDGSLNAVAQAKKANYTDEDGDTTIFEFEKALERPAWGSMKAFVWDNNMKPLLDEELDIEKRSSTLVIGTLGAGGLVDDYFAQRNEAIASLEGKRESFTIQEVNGQLVIAGSDKRGTIYGIYDLCEKMGVSPWKFWADVEPEKAEELYINLPEGGYTEDEPSVEYRGIFLNDEYLFYNWSNSEIPAEVNLKKYEKVYELILRLKMNTLWPAMHHYSAAFHNIDGAAEKADEYGIVMGSSHAEPLLRNNLGELYNFQQEWLARPENSDKKLFYKNSGGSNITDDDGHLVAYNWTDKDNSGNPVDNKEFLTAYWRESVQEYGQYENIYTLGMRGVHDGGFNTSMSGWTEALTEVIAAQKQILIDELCTGENKKYESIDDVPTVFIAYKDVLQYYNKEGHLGLPASTTIMYTDDNYGYMRQNAGTLERSNAGKAGVYYHFSYYGEPRSYLWLSSIQPGLIREELTRSYDMGASRMWIVNVGDLKPAEKEIEYYARLARDIDGMREADISDTYELEAKRDFNLSDTDAEKYAAMMDEYYELANSKRPDFYRTTDAADGFNLAIDAYGDEAQRYLDRYNAILKTAEDIYGSLGNSKKDAFFELVLYPVRSARNMAADFIQTERANKYAEQGRGTASAKYAAEAKAAAEQIKTDTAAYNTTVANGKWNGIMALQPRFGSDAVIEYPACDPYVVTDIEAATIDELDYTAMAVAVDGEITDNPEINLSPYDSYAKFFDVVNTGYGSFNYTVSSNSEAVVPDKASGTAYGSDRVYLTLDKSKASDNTRAVITVTQLLDGNPVETQEITVNISVPDITDMDSTRAYYIEADGVVSVEAEHYTEAHNNESYQWVTEHDFGRSGDSVKAYPATAADVADGTYQTNSAYLEYDVYFTEDGTYTLNLYRMPTLNEETALMRCAVGIDDDVPVRMGGTSSVTSSKAKTTAWGKQVIANTEKLTPANTFNITAGKHTIKLYSVSPGFVADKLVLTKGTSAVYSYFGAPESYNTIYNNKITVPETTADTAADESNNTIDGAEISIKDASGRTILPETSGEFEGKYMLERGTYEITVTANGYAEKTETLNLTPSLSSKDVKITITN